MTTLKRTRELRGWTSTQLAYELMVAARRLNINVATAGSLRVMISRWENNKCQPDARSLLLLETVFELPCQAFGFSQPDDKLTSSMLTLGQNRQSHHNLSDGMLLYFTNQLTEHARMDNMAGALWVADTASTQLRHLQMYVDNGRREVNLLAARYSEFMGWLMHDSGDLNQALKFTQQAIDFAETAGDPLMTIYALMRKSNILTSFAKRQQALSVANKAVNLAKQAAPTLMPVCLRQLALAYAHSGIERGFRQAFERAITLTTPLIDSRNSLSSYCTTSYVEMEAALCWLTLKKPRLAMEACERALVNWPTTMVRDQALCHARRATAYAELNEPQAACEAAQLAIKGVESAQSARTIHMLQMAQKRLEPFRRNSAVREFSEHLATVA